MNIILIGFKNSGKSSTGKQLAHKLGYNFVDTDRLLENIYQQENHHFLTMRQIFQQEGADFFRALEQRAILSLSNIENTVIATGGGSVINPNNVTQLKTLGTIVYLNVAKSELEKRNARHQPPAFLDNKNLRDSFEQTYLTRKPLYEATANLQIVTANKNNNEICEEIIAMCGMW